LTLPAVAERVRKCKTPELLPAFTPESNPAKIGLPIAAFIRISVVGDVFARVAKAVREMPRCWNAIAAPRRFLHPQSCSRVRASIWKPDSTG